MEFLLSFEGLYGKEYCNINLHLHAHLKSCVLEFGPVYSFWLFSFERMNGILGSFKTNSHDISIQLMRRFLTSLQCSVYNWSSDFEAEFSSIMHGCTYSKGSLSPTNLRDLLIETDYSISSVEPISPVYEDALEPHTKREITSVVDANFSFQQFELLTLFQKCGALKIGKYLLGSKSSRFSSTHLVKAETSRNCADGSKLAELHHFARCELSMRESRNTLIWFAAVNFFSEHPCKVWYGKPSEVWPGVAVTGLTYVPLSFIFCTVSYCKALVNFGRIGTDSVFIVSPVN